MRSLVLPMNVDSNSRPPPPPPPAGSRTKTRISKLGTDLSRLLYDMHHFPVFRFPAFVPTVLRKSLADLSNKGCLPHKEWSTFAPFPASHPPLIHHGTSTQKRVSLLQAVDPGLDSQQPNDPQLPRRCSTTAAASQPPCE